MIYRDQFTSKFGQCRVVDNVVDIEYYPTYNFKLFFKEIYQINDDNVL